jgi:hypothetical protein
VLWQIAYCNLSVNPPLRLILPSVDSVNYQVDNANESFFHLLLEWLSKLFSETTDCDPRKLSVQYSNEEG